MDSSLRNCRKTYWQFCKKYRRYHWRAELNKDVNEGKAWEKVEEKEDIMVINEARAKK